MRTANQIVGAEVHHCVSILISKLAAGYGTIQDYHENAQGDGAALLGLIDQAAELCSPVPDYEEAAIQAGWRLKRGEFHHDSHETPWTNHWQELCDEQDIEPYDREVFEHWIVSDWLADKLDAKGEKVDHDFAGLTIWARTTTGQAIAADYVIEQIAKDTGR